MSLRSARERLIQTICYEAGGVLIAAPLYAAVFGATAVASTVLVVVLSIAVLIWSPLHNTLFDVAELRLTNRVASERPHKWRIIHAVSHESTSIVLTLPLIMWLGGHGFWEALAIDIGLTLLYVVYSYIFHIVYDRVRPVARTADTGSGRQVSKR